jgi:hypothetical protein
MLRQLKPRPKVSLSSAMMMVRCAAAAVFRGRAGRDLAFRRGFLTQVVSGEGGAGGAGASRPIVSGALSALVEAGAVRAVASRATSVAAASSSCVSCGVVTVRSAVASCCRQLSIDGVAVGMKGGAVGRNVKATSACGLVMLA